MDKNIRQETASRKANQDLSTALPHDLRTPLTILNGYLDRCLQKTSDIRNEHMLRVPITSAVMTVKEDI